MAVICAGCSAFVALFLYVAWRIYEAFRLTGIPVWSHGKIVATLDPLPIVLGFSLVALAATGLIVRRALASLLGSSGAHGTGHEA